LLHLDPEKRISTLSALKENKYMEDIDFAKVLQRQIKPSFVPSVSFDANFILH
jgi:hypothetical protein